MTANPSYTHTDYILPRFAPLCAPYTKRLSNTARNAQKAIRIPRRENRRGPHNEKSATLPHCAFRKSMHVL